jgi:WD40 repeat protein
MGRMRRVAFLELPTGRKTAERSWPEDEKPKCVALCPDHALLATLSYDGTARIWDMGAGREKRVMSHEHSAVDVMSLARDGKHLLTGIERFPWVYLWDLEKKRRPTILSDGLAGASPLAVRLSDMDQTVEMFAATSGWENGKIHLFDTTTGKPVRTIDTPPIRSPALSFSPDGSLLATGMIDTSILIFDVGKVVGRSATER